MLTRDAVNSLQWDQSSDSANAKLSNNGGKMRWALLVVDEGL